MNRVYRNFLGNGPNSETSHTLIGWDDITYPYDEGGLGVRDIITVNKACVLRHVWNIESDRDILWVKWIKKHRIRGKNFWALKILNNCSWSWKAILKGRRDATYMVRHLIGNGEAMRIWLDPWQHRGLLKEWFPIQLMYNSNCNIKAKVSSLIVDGKWSIPSVMARATPDIHAFVEDTVIHEGSDEIIWASAQ